MERSARDYGTGEGLFSSEIHTVTAVVHSPGINLTQLAGNMGISKAAVSKFTSRMIKRGYIKKSRSGSNQKEVLFYATEKGRSAAQGHAAFEEKTFGPFLRIEQDLTAKEREIILSYFKKIKNIIEE
nr:MarR family transcriptional regulator [uncultured Sphaerochaeta sp.]